jgi:hypothetical protein
VKLEIRNWEKQKDVNALPNFKFPVSTSETGRLGLLWRNEDVLQYE